MFYGNGIEDAAEHAARSNFYGPAVGGCVTAQEVVVCPANLPGEIQETMAAIIDAEESIPLELALTLALEKIVAENRQARQRVA